MSFPYISVEDAIRRPGLRMVVVGDVPSPWSEAAKGLLHIKRIDWAAVRLVYDSESLEERGGGGGGPVRSQSPTTRSRGRAGPTFYFSPSGSRPSRHCCRSSQQSGRSLSGSH